MGRWKFDSKSDDFWLEIAKTNCCFSLANMEFEFSAERASESCVDAAQRLEKFVDNFIKRKFELKLDEDKVKLAPRLLDCFNFYKKLIESYKDEHPTIVKDYEIVAKVIHKVLSYIKSVEKSVEKT